MLDKQASSSTLSTSSMIAGPIISRRRGVLLPLLVAILYGGVLASLPVEVFNDRPSYLTYAFAAPVILERYIVHGLLTTLVNEPVWLLLNSLFGLFFTPGTIVRLLIFVPASVVAWLTLKYHMNWIGWAILFLLFPAVIKNHIIHLRQGVAIAFFLWGWYSPRLGWRWAIWLLTPLIHAAFFFVLFIYGLIRLGRVLHLAPDLCMLIIFCIAIVISLNLPWLASSLGARQAIEHSLREVHVSGLGFLFWLFILMLFFLQGFRFLRRYLFEVATLVFYLGTYFFGAVSARIFESTLLLLLLVGLRLTRYRRILFRAAIIGFVVLSYWMRLDEPLLGWGY